MSTDQKECNRVDVLELTRDLRKAKSWAPLRNAIIGKGISIKDTALPFFAEDEYGSEFGLLVTVESVFEFEFDEGLNIFKKWNKSSEPEGEYDDSIQEVEWTREMLKNKDI